MAILKRVYTPLKATVSMITSNSQLVQEYDIDNDIFYPDRRIVPTVIQPILSIQDPAQLIKGGDGQKNHEISLDSLKWYINEVSTNNEITPSNSNFIIDRTETKYRGRIIVMQNTPDTDPLTLIFEGTYYDYIEIDGVNRVRRKVPFQGSVTLASNITAITPLELKKYYLRGQFRIPSNQHSKLLMSVGLHNGSNFIPAAYWWYKEEGKGDQITYTLIGDEYDGYNENLIKIPIEDVGKENHYVVIVQNCTSDLNDLRHNYYLEHKDTYEGDLEDLKIEAFDQVLPKGYRPENRLTNPPTPGDEKNDDNLYSDKLILGTKYPTYSWRIVTEHGDDSDIITIPYNVDQFDAWVIFTTPAGEITEEIANDFWDVTWDEEGLKTGIRQTFSADAIGLGFQKLEPKIREKIK